MLMCLEEISNSEEVGDGMNGTYGKAIAHI